MNFLNLKLETESNFHKFLRHAIFTNGMAKKQFICKVCGLKAEVINSVFKKSISLQSNCCSLSCFKLTEEYLERRKNSDKLRVQKIKETGSFSRNGSASKITRAKRFLESNDVSCSCLSDEEIVARWKLEFNRISNHGEKIKSGREKIYPNPNERKAADKERVVKGSCKIVGIQYRDDFTDQEKQEITKKAYQNFRVKDTRTWKIKHIIKNSTIDVACLSSSDIDKLYSEYVSLRFSRASLESDRNGYARSSKGWYDMTNQCGDRFFYRSTWEKIVFEALDILTGEGKIRYVKNPDRIQYELDGIKRHYYPDASYVSLSGKTIVLEIKPKRKLDEHINSAKIKEAIKLLGECFQVLTEDEIFEGELLKKLENY